MPYTISDYRLVIKDGNKTLFAVIISQGNKLVMKRFNIKVLTPIYSQNMGQTEKFTRPISISSFPVGKSDASPIILTSIAMVLFPIWSASITQVGEGTTSGIEKQVVFFIFISDSMNWPN